MHLKCKITRSYSSVPGPFGAVLFPADPYHHRAKLATLSAVKNRSLVTSFLAISVLGYPTNQPMSMFLSQPLILKGLSDGPNTQAMSLPPHGYFHSNRSGCVAAMDLLSEGSANEEQLYALAKQGDEAAENTLLLRHEGFLKLMARKFQKIYRLPAEDFYDLMQVGRMGMLRAFRSFTYGRVPFITYAKYWMRKYMRERILDESSEIIYPRAKSQKFHKMRKDANTNSLEGNNATPYELLIRQGYSVEMIELYFQWSIPTIAWELLAPVLEGEFLPFQHLELEEIWKHLSVVLKNKLTPVEFKLVVGSMGLFGYSELSPAEIADQMSCSERYVSGILSSAAKKLGDGDIRKMKTIRQLFRPWSSDPRKSA